jgi:hypothetical protein
MDPLTRSAQIIPHRRPMNRFQHQQFTFWHYVRRQYTRLSQCFWGRIVFVLILFVTVESPAHAELVTLYSGSGLPSAEPWLVYGFDSVTGASQTNVAGGVRLVTDETTRAGYSNYNVIPTTALKNPAFPSLNRANGFELSFSLALTGESHTSNDRAGFSVILLGSDAKGIELGFWQNEIWAQNAGFIHGEGIAFNTVPTQDYKLRIVNDNYTLSQGANQLLTGNLRSYGSSQPYSLSNYIFLGDNTTSAQANALIGAIKLESNLASVPEPSTFILLGSAAIALRGLRFLRRPRA